MKSNNQKLRIRDIVKRESPIARSPFLNKKANKRGTVAKNNASVP